MRHLVRRAALVALFFIPAVAFAQTGEALLKKIGTSNRIENPTFPASTKLEYKVAWDVTVGAAKPEDPTAGFLSALDAVVNRPVINDNDFRLGAASVVAD